MSWDPLQREVLEALGHAVYRLAAEESGGTDASSAAAADDPLLRALLRAAARDASDTAALAGAWSLTTQLRGDPAAKRALWPRLRALRASSARA